MDRLPQILLVAGIGFFGLSFVVSGLYPWLITDAQHPMATLEELARFVPRTFKELKEAHPVAFDEAFPQAREAHLDRDIPAVVADEVLRRRDANEPEIPAAELEQRVRARSQSAWEAAYAQALRRGRDVYVAEACWHCHSQYVRPVANEELRFGPVREPRHDNNALQRPVLWGTRRVGPDLTHEGGKRSNDWHVAHLWDPESTSPDSIMPPFPWFFREGWQIRRTINADAAERGGLPEEMSHPYPGLYDSEAGAREAMERLKATLPSNLEEEKESMFVARARGPGEPALALITYLQWLGTWEPDREEAGR